MCDIKDKQDYTRDAEREAGMEVNNRGVLNGNAQKYWEWMRLVLGTLIIPWCMWISYTLVGIDKRVAIIENNRFSSEDGIEVWRSLSSKANKEDIPPQWFIDEFNRLRDDFSKHEVLHRE